MDPAFPPAAYPPQQPVPPPSFAVGSSSGLSASSYPAFPIPPLPQQTPQDDTPMSESEDEERPTEQEEDPEADDAEFKDSGDGTEDDDDGEGEATDDSDQPVRAPGHANKKKKKGKPSKGLNLPKHFDADLYGLRRSVSLPQFLCSSELLDADRVHEIGSRFNCSQSSEFKLLLLCRCRY